MVQCLKIVAAMVICILVLGERILGYFFSFSTSVSSMFGSW